VINILIWQTIIKAVHKLARKQLFEIILDYRRNFALNGGDVFDTACRANAKYNTPAMCKHYMTDCFLCKFGNPKYWGYSRFIYWKETAILEGRA
jgi:hypothetical protein